MRTKMVELPIPNTPMDVPNVLSRYSWDAKVEVCNRVFRKIFGTGFVFNATREALATASPWDLNVFAALCTIYPDGCESEMPDGVFKAIIRIIRKQKDGEKLRTISDVKVLCARLSAIQFTFQENLLIPLFRYLYLFSYRDGRIDIAALFKKVYGVDSIDVLAFITLIDIEIAEGRLWWQFIEKMCREQMVWPNAYFRTVMDLLSIDRQSFVRKQGELFASSRYGWAGAMNILEEHPFIKIGEGYSLPLPYLANVAPRHMFDRLMDGDRSLRSKCGHIMETHVLELLRLSECYEQVMASQKYKYHKQEIDSPDVIAVTQGKIIFFEVKLSEAPLSLRQATEELLEETYKLYAKGVYQLYERINEICKLGGLNGIKCDRSNVYGILIFHIEANPVRSDVYEACFKAHPELTDEDREFIRTRISITGLYTIEYYAYSHTNVIEGLQLREKDKVNQESMSLHIDDVITGNLKLPFEILAYSINQRIPYLFDSLKGK